MGGWALGGSGRAKGLSRGHRDDRLGARTLRDGVRGNPVFVVVRRPW